MRNDLDLLQGSWTVAALEVDGQEMPAAMLANARIAIAGDRFDSSGMGAAYRGTLALDASASPRRFDMRFDEGPEKGNTNSGIYELNGKTWRICIATRGGARPASFATSPGTGFALETLIRGERPAAVQAEPRNSAPDSPPDSAPATGFEGEWLLMSGVMNGAPMEESTIQWVKRVTRGSRTTVFAGPQTMMEFEFTSDSSASPKTIDYLNTAGPNKGKKQLGIYECEGGLLRICVAAPGDPRPRDFQPGKSGTLTVWRRA